jgi:hypothetical protein
MCASALESIYASIAAREVFTKYSSQHTCTHKHVYTSRRMNASTWISNCVLHAIWHVCVCVCMCVWCVSKWDDAAHTGLIHACMYSLPATSLTSLWNGATCPRWMIRLCADPHTAPCFHTNVCVWRMYIHAAFMCMYASLTLLPECWLRPHMQCTHMLTSRAFSFINTNRPVVRKRVNQDLCIYLKLRALNQTSCSHAFAGMGVCTRAIFRSAYAHQGWSRKGPQTAPGWWLCRAWSVPGSHYVCICDCACIHPCIHACMSVWACIVYICTHEIWVIHTYTCTYTYMYVYIYIYIYIYIICLHTFVYLTY